MTAQDAAELEIDIAVEAERWRAHRGARSVVRRALQEAHAATRGRSRRRLSVAVLLTDDRRIRAVNQRWRGQDKPTNVLSFPAPAPAIRSRQAALLGDIVIACETLEREAAAEDKPFSHHLAHLAVHGFLHLIGYDHLTEQDAAAMELRERAILKRLRVPDPYAGSEPARGINDAR